MGWPDDGYHLNDLMVWKESEYLSYEKTVHSTSNGVDFMPDNSGCPPHISSSCQRQFLLLRGPSLTLWWTMYLCSPQNLIQGLNS